jgi:DnaJ-class molecular chaperone
MSAQILFDMKVGEAFEYREKTQALAVKAVEERAAKAAAKATEKAAPEEKPAAAAKAAPMKRKRVKCEHGRQRSLCKDCGGSGVCEHGRQRNVCKECGGSSICERARAAAQPVQGLLRRRHLQARACAQRV